MLLQERAVRGHVATPPELATLVDSKKWDEVEKALSHLLPTLTDIERFPYQLQLVQVLLGNGKVAEANRSLQAAFRLLDSDAVQGASNWFWLAANAERLGQVSLAKVAIDRIGDDCGLRFGVRAMRDRIERAVTLSESFAECQTKLIALGQNCIPDDLADRWGLGALRIDGPFHAASFYGDGAAVALADGLSKFADRHAYKVSNMASGIRAAALPAYRALFNHEAGSFWLNGGLKRLRSCYRTRGENFRRAMECQRILFVYVAVSAADLDSLWSAVKSTAPRADIRLLVFDFVDLAEPAPGTWRRVSMAYPSRDYAWYKLEDYNTTAGLEFEKRIVDEIVKEVESL